jgi:serine/threonine-protein kinase RsbW
VSASVSLKIGSDLAQLEQVTAAVEEIGRLEDWPPKLVFEVTLVLDELGVNIVKYGGEVSEIEVSLSSGKEAVTIEITDDGRPFDPASASTWCAT